MKRTPCTTENQVCWYCSKDQQARCDRMVRDNYYKPVRSPETVEVMRKRLVWGY